MSSMTVLQIQLNFDPPMIYHIHKSCAIHVRLYSRTNNERFFYLLRFYLLVILTGGFVKQPCDTPVRPSHVYIRESCNIPKKLSRPPGHQCLFSVKIGRRRAKKAISGLLTHDHKAEGISSLNDRLVIIVPFS